MLCTGIYPVPPEQRIDRQFHKVFFVWFAMNFNILSYVNPVNRYDGYFADHFERRLSTGTTGPIVYGLGLRDSCLLILFLNILCCIPPAYLYAISHTSLSKFSLSQQQNDLGTEAWLAPNVPSSLQFRVSSVVLFIYCHV